MSASTTTSASKRRIVLPSGSHLSGDVDDWIRGQLGIFRLHTAVLHSLGSSGALELMRHFVILRAESHFHDASIEYLAYSPLFDAVQFGDRVPSYVLTIHTDPDDGIRLEVERMPDLSAGDAGEPETW